MIERGVAHTLLLADELAGQYGTADAIALTRYRTEDDYAGSLPDRDGLPHACHAAMLGRILIAFERLGRAVVINYG